MPLASLKGFADTFERLISTNLDEHLVAHALENWSYSESALSILSLAALCSTLTVLAPREEGLLSVRVEEAVARFLIRGSAIHLAKEMRRSSFAIRAFTSSSSFSATGRPSASSIK